MFSIKKMHTMDAAKELCSHRLLHLADKLIKVFPFQRQLISPQMRRHPMNF